MAKVLFSYTKVFKIPETFTFSASLRELSIAFYVKLTKSSISMTPVRFGSSIFRILCVFSDFSQEGCRLLSIYHNMAESDDLQGGVLLILSLLVLVLMISQLVKKLPIIDMAGVATIIGIVFGEILLGTHRESLTESLLNVNLLFVFLIPPIIFESAYNMNRVSSI